MVSPCSSVCKWRIVIFGWKKWRNDGSIVKVSKLTCKNERSFHCGIISSRPSRLLFLLEVEHDHRHANPAASCWLRELGRVHQQLHKEVINKGSDATISILFVTKPLENSLVFSSSSSRPPGLLLKFISSNDADSLWSHTPRVAHEEEDHHWQWCCCCCRQGQQGMSWWVFPPLRRIVSMRREKSLPCQAHICLP